MAGPLMNTVAKRLKTLARHFTSAHTPQQVPELHQAGFLPFSTETSGPFINAQPRVALYDDEVKITLHNFPPQEKVTLHGQVMQLSSRIIFASCGHFVTSSKGEVDLYCDASQGGTFTGVEPMGILWSLRTAPGQPRDTRMAINFTDRPCQVTLQTYMGHLSLEDIHKEDSSSLTVVAELLLERSFRGTGVIRMEIEEGNIRGALYLPPGDGPFPGVIDMFGSSGGLIEYRSALLASRGFATLSLAYFNYKDLQDSLYNLKYEYFEEAINWLSCHPKVVSAGIGVMAVSKGVENALLMGAYSNKVTAVIAINGYCHVSAGTYLRDNKLLCKGVDLDTELIEMTEEGMDVQKLFAKWDDIIPFWKGKAKYLFFDSVDDFQKSPDANYHVLNNVCPENKKKDIQVVRYEGAGHLLEPPYNPLCRSSVNKGFGIKMKWGGKPRQHAYAQIDAWQRTLNFLRQNIPS